MNYYWVRVFDYSNERDQHDKGTMLDEFYLKGDDLSRDAAKQAVRDRYGGQAATEIKFAKPRKSDGLYAVVMDSEKFFYDRFYLEIDTHCFWCHKPIKGKAAEFPHSYGGDVEKHIYDLDDPETVYFCTYGDRRAYERVVRNSVEGEYQEKQAGQGGEVCGYIYLIYNRAENKYYIGQAKHMPFFRWQEHVKDGAKGEISDMSFSVLTEVRRDRRLTDEGNQKYLNSIEAWWIKKYQHEGHDVFNIAKPHITIDSLRQRFNDMIAKRPEQAALAL
ncbi:GIY-YIG nuclease family protein [Tumebacillus permanentifrigoris]|uniref:GIY-YIG catalytic domain-containing protein n=1 Tax=Tumebacillus permanentifrigoris TaxID=378543 RepID=A0A316DQ84_9BACL|nr:GIY-YIG nuclease family protein [Tumebacillus permanentifrigoris]PWK05326.1 GIY-YIG catalytic domain-containing protein [Tumebacillus permanentifrigoris]